MRRTPRLASKARLRWDNRLGKTMLLYPERGLLLSESASAILRKCDGHRSIDTIVTELIAEIANPDIEKVRDDVHAFLAEMEKSGLLEFP